MFEILAKHICLIVTDKKFNITRDTTAVASPRFQMWPHGC